jgi:hypothetical protein
MASAKFTNRTHDHRISFKNGAGLTHHNLKHMQPLAYLGPTSGMKFACTFVQESDEMLPKRLLYPCCDAILCFPSRSWASTSPHT